ncbi:N-acetyltransferase [Desulfonema ishimotonii]|uniref:N-acetyltransferase n=1 Tax=Desulfonema ishimotonii TaxID=45657 RepID=A0A401G299_9BACT|nr:N-acetyltransferase [Desulfonema ishimotonii]GBC63350.1 N-acetyltransferase [Desulfonema ishimotonii]
MNRKITVRPETEQDVKRIEEITVSAFADHPHSNQTEHLLVAGLRHQGALALSLVAETGGHVVGHIAFSEVTINGEHLSWYGLAPLSVDPGFQNQGIGSELMRAGLHAIREMGARGCVLVGEPQFYGRFGFTSEKALTMKGVPPEYFLILSLDGSIPSGNVEHHKIFSEIG